MSTPIKRSSIVIVTASLLGTSYNVSRKWPSITIPSLIISYTEESLFKHEEARIHASLLDLRGRFADGRAT